MKLNKVLRLVLGVVLGLSRGLPRSSAVPEAEGLQSRVLTMMRRPYSYVDVIVGFLKLCRSVSRECLRFLLSALRVA